MGLQDALITHLSDRPAHSSRTSIPRAYMSEAGQCARKIALRIWHHGDPPARHEPEAIRLTGLLAFKIGETVHDAVQAAMTKAYAGFTAEVPCELPGIGGRSDGVYRAQNGKLIVVEIKTKSPDQFKKFKTAGQPEFDNVLQAVLGALALGAELVHIIYINKAARYFESPILEWIYDLNDFLPEDADFPLGELGQVEATRLENIVLGAREGKIPAPEYHGQVITNPDKQFFPCAFCPFSDECKMMGPQPVQEARWLDDTAPFTEAEAVRMFHRSENEEAA